MPIRREPSDFYLVIFRMESMNQSELLTTLDALIAEWEHEIAEFKEAGNDYRTDDIGKYFSALSNEANLAGMDGGWLVFGVSNNDRSVVGCAYRPVHENLQSIKQQIAQDTEPGIGFRGVYEVSHPNGRVVMFYIPAAPQGMPIAWKGHYYGRNGESLDALALDKLDRIRSQSGVADWTSQTVDGAVVDHLDDEALAVARGAFAEKYANSIPTATVESWTTIEFLNRAKLASDGRITRAALLLLGKPDSAHLLSPHPAQITWKLQATDPAYEQFAPPFLLTTTSVYRRIRNVQLRIQPANSLLPVEVSKYDQSVVLEALHNCLAHQDYGRFARVLVTEHEDRVVLENEGSFFEAAPADYVKEGGRTPRRYRNPFLAQAMAELNMIDTMGFGIYRMFARQAKRYFPLPDFDLNTPDEVKVTLHGALIDPAYSSLLLEKTDLPLGDILALDRVQKSLAIDDQTIRHLRKVGLIEGRKPNLRVSEKGVHAPKDRVTYILTRGQDDEFYEKLTLDFIRQWGSASRKDVDNLLKEKLSDSLDDTQRTNKVSNLLTGMRRRGLIVNTGARKTPRWKLQDKENKTHGM